MTQIMTQIKMTQLKIRTEMADTKMAISFEPSTNFDEIHTVGNYWIIFSTNAYEQQMALVVLNY